MVLMVSGAPLTDMRIFPLGRADTVDMRFKAEENWNRRRIWIAVRWGAEAEAGVI